jgi:hypothetical protein
MNVDKVLAEFRRYNQQHQAQPGAPIKPPHREEAALQEVPARYRAEAKDWDSALRELSVGLVKALAKRGMRTRPLGLHRWHRVP